MDGEVKNTEMSKMRMYLIMTDTPHSNRLL